MTFTGYYRESEATPSEMSRPQGGRIQVPDDLREILLEFTISYLLEQPGDVINYAVEFFTRLQNNRTTTIVRAPAAGTPDESIISDEEGTISLILLLDTIQDLSRNCVKVGRIGPRESSHRIIPFPYD